MLSSSVGRVAQKASSSVITKSVRQLSTASPSINLAAFRSALGGGLKQPIQPKSPKGRSAAVSGAVRSSSSSPDYMQLLEKLRQGEPGAATPASFEAYLSQLKTQAGKSQVSA